VELVSTLARRAPVDVDARRTAARQCPCVQATGRADIQSHPPSSAHVGPSWASRISWSPGYGWAGGVATGISCARRALDESWAPERPEGAWPRARARAGRAGHHSGLRSSPGRARTQVLDEVAELALLKYQPRKGLSAVRGAAHLIKG